MAVWLDPLLPEIKVPPDLKKQWFQLGSAKFQLTPSQYKLLLAKEERVCVIGGYGSSKTKGGVYKVSHLAMFPNNRIIVGRFAATDLEETTQRDLCDFLYEAGLMKTPPNQKSKKAVVYCVDPVTQKNLGYTTEISFQHMDDPTHLNSRHVGAFWIDEASQVHKDAGKHLAGRLRWPAFAGRYQGIFTGNPNGHNYLYDDFFNEEEITKLICGHPACKLSPEDCNKNLRLKRRGIHATTYDNYFLPPDYVEGMLASYSPNERQRYLEASFDVFEGAAFGEFSHDLHVLGGAVGV